MTALELKSTFRGMVVGSLAAAAAGALALLVISLYLKAKK